MQMRTFFFVENGHTTIQLNVEFCEIWINKEHLNACVKVRQYAVCFFVHFIVILMAF